MKKYFLSFLIILFGATFSSAIVLAQQQIVYPISELGNCSSKAECKKFCDVPENVESCMLWAEKIGMMSKRESKDPNIEPRKGGEGIGDNPSGISREEYERNMEMQKNSPGGCGSPAKCDAYCRIEEHMDECLNFSVKYGFMKKEEAEKLKAKATKGGPGGCKGEDECKAFCRDAKNARECMNFVVSEGDITQEEADFMVEQMQNGGGRPKAEGPREAKIDKEKVQTTLQSKAGPGGCKSMEECRNYCEGGEHMDECLAFARENKLMDPTEIEKAEKIGKMGGPGGCKNAAECDAFCSEPANRETCFNFAKDNSLMSEEEIQKMQKQMEIMKKMETRRPRPQGQGQAPQDRPGMVPGQERRSFFDGPDMPESSMQRPLQGRGYEEGQRPSDAPDAQYGPPQGYEGRMPPTGVYPSEDMRPPEGYDYRNGPPPGVDMPPQEYMQREGFQMPSGGDRRYGPPPGYEGAPMPSTVPQPIEGVPMPLVPPTDGNQSIRALNVVDMFASVIMGFIYLFR